MWDLETIMSKLQSNLDDKRFTHSLNVMETAEKIAAHYGEDTDKARIAGLLHDCGKIAKGEELLKIYASYGLPMRDIEEREPGLLHAALGVHLAEKIYGVNDREILSAIATHTTGCPDMSMLQKIVFIADYTEPDRKYEGVGEVRKWISSDLDKALLIAFNQIIKRVIDRGRLLHPDTVKARNSLLSRALSRGRFS